VTRAVLDANVLASGAVGLLIVGSTPGQLLRLWLDDAFELIVSDQLRTEVSRTLQKPYFLSRLAPERIANFNALLQERATSTPLTVQVSGVATHPEDDLVLAAAASARADYLVTGDHQLQKLGSYRGVKIVSPAEFLEVLRQQPSN
jgi:putative PIN family toxin of toxin-antitoxin system